MSVNQQLLDEIRAALGSAVSPSLTNGSDGSDLYEAYLFGLVLDAARQEGAQFRFENVDGPTTSTFTFRTSPMKMQTRTRPYSHAVLEFAGKPDLELHTGIFINGGSKVAHESDVVVLHRSEARACRNDPEIVPRSGKVLLTIEAKFYASQFKLHLARGFLGLCADYGVRDSFLVTNTESESVAALLAHKNRLFLPLVEPQALSQVARLMGLLRTAFANFKARR